MKSYQDYGSNSNQVQNAAPSSQHGSWPHTTHTDPSLKKGSCEKKGKKSPTHAKPATPNLGKIRTDRTSNRGF